MKLVYWVVLCAAATPTALWNRVENQHHCYVSGMLEWGLEFQKLPKTLLWDSVKLFLMLLGVRPEQSTLNSEQRVLYTQYRFIRNGLKCKKNNCFQNHIVTCSWHQKNETTYSPSHAFKVLQNFFESL